MAKATRTKGNAPISSQDADKLVGAFAALQTSIEKILQSQGDFQGILRRTISDVRKLDTSYEKIQARVASFSRETVNVKKINSELQKLKQKEFIEDKKYNSLILEYKEKGKDLAISALDLAKQDAQQKVDQAKALGQTLDYEEALLSNLEKQGNLESVKLYAREKQRDLSKELREIGEEDLKNEKLVANQLGISGNLVGAMAKKLGVGSEAYSAMTQSARDLVEKNGKVTFSLAPMKAGLKSVSSSLLSSFSSASLMTKALGAVGVVLAGASFIANKLGDGLTKAAGLIRGLSSDTSTVFAGVASHITTITEKIPIIGGLLGGLVNFWSSILDLVIGVEDRVVKMGRQVGLSASEATKLNDKFQDIALNSEKAYVNSKALFESQLQLTTATGLNNIATKDNLETNIELAKFAGIELETRGKIYEASLATGTSMRSVASTILGQVANLSKATGISFNYQSILKEAASQSGRLGLMFAKYPKELTRSLIATKALGFELKQLESIGDSLLDFESSISKQFEAQLLTGKNINLIKAQEAFLNGRLEDAAVEITKQVGDANSFLNLNRIQQQSIADAVGMTVDSLSDLLKKQEIYAKLGAVDKKDLMEKIKLSRENTKERERIIELIGKEQYKNLYNLSTQETLLETFEKIKASIADFLTRSNIADYVRNIMEELTKPGRVKSFINQVREGMLTVFDFVSSLTSVMLTVLQKIGSALLFITFQFKKRNEFNEIMGDLESKVESMSSKIKDSLSREITISEPKLENRVGGLTESENKPIKMTTKSVKDAVIFPSSNMIINKDPLDYTIFAKNPSNLSSPIDKETIKQVVSEAVSAFVKDRPIVVHTQANLNLDGQVAAKSNYTNMKNNPIIGFDRTFGQMSLNT